MNYREILITAWGITRDHRGLLKYGIIPSFFGSIVGFMYISYQIFAFKHSKIFGGDSGRYVEVIQNVWDFILSYTGFAFALLGGGILLLLLYFLIPIIFTGSLIDLVAKIRTQRPATGGLASGVLHFLPLFQFSAMTSPFHFITLFSESAFVLRNLGTGIWFFLFPIILIFAITGGIFTMIFAYAEQYIVLEDKKMGEALFSSTRLVIENLKEAFFLAIMMIIVSLRVLLNVVVILFLPLLFILFTGWLATTFSQTIAITIGLIIGIIILSGSSYLLGGFTVLQNAVWTVSFLEFRKKQEWEKEQNPLLSKEETGGG